jgi:fatty acid desaturase
VQLLCVELQRRHIDMPNSNAAAAKMQMHFKITIWYWMSPSDLVFDGWVGTPRRITTRSLTHSCEVSLHAGSARPRRLELPTLGIAFLVYGGFILVTWCFRDMPMAIAAPLGALLLTWYGSLQHETIHGHPTSSPRINRLTASLPLSLWIPYGIYRATHLKHHRLSGRHLTEVPHDPETFYRAQGSLSQAGTLRRAIYAANCTMAGRLILGPALAVGEFWASEARQLLAGDRCRAAIWLRHVLAAAVVLLWTVGVCHIPFLVYAALVVYPSVSLTQLRSFAEHRAHTAPQLRTLAVEANLVWGLIFLNNNLHIAHHAHPTLPWFELPRVWRSMRGSAIDSGLVIRGGYRQVVKKYMFRPVISVEHPGSVGDRD